MNNIAENVTRPTWKVTETARQKVELDKLEKELADIGPELETSAILDIVVQELFSKDIYWENLIKKVWESYPKTLPTSNVWECSPQIDMPGFINSLQSAIHGAIYAVFRNNSLKLQRFSTFEQGLQTIIRSRINALREPFLNRWTQLSIFNMNIHNTVESYSPKLWDRAIVCCTVQEIFMKLSEQEVGPGINHNTLGDSVKYLGALLSCEENKNVAVKRASLNAKITAMHEIIAML